MAKRFVFVVCLQALLAVAVAIASTCSFSIGSPFTLGSAELKPGDYSVEVKGTVAVISPKRGEPYSVPVKVEVLEKKFNQDTALEFATKDGKKFIQAITVGHSKTRLVFGQ